MPPTQAEIEDFAARNVNANGTKDYHRAVEALTNDTGDRDFDSQGPMYDQRTNQLSPAGVQATAQLQQRRAAMPSAMGGSLSSLLNYQPTRGMGAPMLTANAAPGTRDTSSQPTSVQPVPHIFGNDTRSTGFTPGAPVYNNSGRVVGTYGPNGQILPVSTSMPVGGSPQLSALLRSY